MNNEYDIGKAFQRIEESLIKSMKRNLTRHLNEERDLDMNWSQWQTEQLKSLEHFKRNNKQIFKNDFSTINNEVESLIKQSFEDGKLNQERVILEAIKEGNFNSNDKQINKLWHIHKNTKNKRIKKKQLTRIYQKTEQAEANFFKINDRKLNALIKETTENFQKAELSILRYTNDQYRQIIYDAQVYANTGSGTVQQAVDMATKDFFSKGINSIEYSNGAMVNIASYAEMAIRTANKRAYLQGEGTKRAEWGVHTVLVPNRGGGCPYCIKFQGKVFVDDVWSNGTAAESNETGYPLLSTAIKAKLFHPNCKDTVVTYFPGINTKPIPPTEKELEKKKENYIIEQKQRYNERQIRKYKRLELGSVDSENIEKYHNKRIQWQKYNKEFCEEHNLKRQYERENIKGIVNIEKTTKNDIILSDEEKNQIKEYTRFDATRINKAIRKNEVSSDLQKKIDVIDGAIEKAKPLPKDLILHRGTIIQSFNGFERINKISHEEVMNLKERVITDKAFISTSKVKAEEQGRNIIMKIKVPKGFKGVLDIEEYATEKYKYQKEVLLKRNTKFRVDNVVYEDGKYYFDTEVIE